MQWLTNAIERHIVFHLPTRTRRLVPFSTTSLQSLTYRTCIFYIVQHPVFVRSSSGLLEQQHLPESGILLMTVRAYWSKRRVVILVLFRTNYYPIENFTWCHCKWSLLVLFTMQKLHVLLMFYKNCLFKSLFSHGGMQLQSIFQYLKFCMYFYLHQHRRKH